MDSTNKLTKVIAIYSAGHGSGKSTLARFLCDYLTDKNHNVAIKSFAENIKAMAWNLLDYETVYRKKDEPCEKLYGKTPRDLLIVLGEALKEKIGKRIFADALIRDIEETDADIIIIDDLRFPVELHRLREEYGPDLVVVYLEGPTDSPNQDPSTEGLLDEGEADVHITNVGTLGHLYDKAVFIATEVLGIE